MSFYELQVMSGTDQLLTVAEHFKPVFEKTVQVAVGPGACCKWGPNPKSWEFKTQMSQALCKDVQQELIKDMSEANSQDHIFAAGVVLVLRLAF